MTDLGVLWGLATLTLVIVLILLKRHIMRSSPGHPEHERVCRNPACPCRRDEPPPAA